MDFSQLSDERVLGHFTWCYTLIAVPMYHDVRSKGGERYLGEQKIWNII